ncbi:MAG: head GIN domain-containing protein [Chitinophagaceae bacterium]
MKGSFLLFLLALFTFSSCHYFGGKRIGGNGNVITRDHSVGSFQRVEVSGALDVYLKQDSTQQPVKVETDENLQDLIEVRESNGVLYISPVDHYNLDPTRLKIYVAAPQFKGLGVSGASHIYGENKLISSESFDIDLSGASEMKLEIKAPRINSEVTGASSVELRGETKDFNANGSGASSYKCFDLMTENTTVDISGACSADIFASVKLNVQASGASEVKYRGAAAITQDISGASGIKKVD